MNSAGIWVSPIGGYLSDRLGRVPLIISSCLVSAFVVFMLNWAPYYWGVAALMLLSGIAMYTRMPVSEAYIIGQTTERNRSKVYGVYYFSMTESGAIFAPIMGYLMDIYGFSKCFTWASVAIIVVIMVFAPMLKGSKN
jgi:MFS family permease